MKFQLKIRSVGISASYVEEVISGLSLVLNGIPALKREGYELSVTPTKKISGGIDFLVTLDGPLPSTLDFSPQDIADLIGRVLKGTFDDEPTLPLQLLVKVALADNGEKKRGVWKRARH